MPSADNIKRFIRNTLGCNCPEEVFQSMEVRRAVRLNSFIVLDSVLVIGHRLLVYVVEAGAESCIEEHLPVLVAAGSKERDEKGLNRFRLALVTDDPEAVGQTAERIFKELRGMDEKAHLHVIRTSENPLAAEEDAEGRRVESKV